MMRTTIDIDRQLLERAKLVLEATTYKQTIELALVQAIHHADLRRLVESIEHSDATSEIDELLAYRRLGRDDATGPACP